MSTVLKTEERPIRVEADIVQVRQVTRARAVEAGFGLVDQTKMITAASELARNTLIYGGGGTVRLDTVQDGRRCGLRLTFEDRGPGIADVSLAMQDGFSGGSGLGLGLGGSRRLVSEFAIDSEVGRGTRVTITKWK